MFRFPLPDPVRPESKTAHGQSCRPERSEPVRQRAGPGGIVDLPGRVTGRALNGRGPRIQISAQDLLFGRSQRRCSFVRWIEQRREIRGIGDRLSAGKIPADIQRRLAADQGLPLQQRMGRLGLLRCPIGDDTIRNIGPADCRA